MRFGTWSDGVFAPGTGSPADAGCAFVRRVDDAARVEIVLRTVTPDGVEVVLSAIVYAKVLEEHPTVADLEMIDRTVRRPDERRPDPRPGRERFFRREGTLYVLAVLDFTGVPAIIVTVFSAEHPPT